MNVNAIYLLYDVFTSMLVLEYDFFNRLREFSDSLAIKLGKSYVG